MKVHFRFGRLKQNLAGYREFRKHPKSRQWVRQEAGAVADAAGPTYEVHDAPSSNRARVTVYSEDPKAIVQDNKNQTLLGAIGQVKR